MTLLGHMGWTERLLIVAAVIVILAGSALDFPTLSTRSTTATSITTERAPSSLSVSTSFANGTLVRASPVSANGLQLRITLNSSIIAYNGTIDAQVELLSTNDSVTLPVPQFSMQETVVAWNQYDYVCGQNPSNSIIGYAVFRGQYSSDNISSAGEPLHLGAPFFPPCPNAGPYPYGLEITFSKGIASHLNVTTGYCSPGPGMFGDCGLLRPLDGYYDANAGWAYTPFQSGEYTLAATDLWNQTVCATFLVQSGPAEAQ